MCRIRVRWSAESRAGLENLQHAAPLRGGLSTVACSLRHNSALSVGF